MLRLLVIVLTLGSFILPTSAWALSAILNWTDVSGEDGYVVQRKDTTCAATGSFNTVTTTAANVVTYTDTAVVAGGSYCYRVAGYNAAGNGNWSNTAGITFPLPPAAPSLQVTPGP